MLICTQRTYNMNIDWKVLRGRAARRGKVPRTGKDPSVTAETGLLPGGITDHDGRKTTTRRCCVLIVRRTARRRRRRTVSIATYDIREKMSMSGI